jgi:hypothetical protein
MKKPAVNDHKAHKSPQWRTETRAPGLGYRPEFCSGTPASDAGAGPARPAGRRARWRVSLLRGKSLNWSLRRYVRASSLRVWLRRHAPEAGGAPVPAGGTGSFRVAGRPAETAREARSPAPGGRPWRAAVQGSRAAVPCPHGNRQMEHLTQVAVSLRGGVRRGGVITPRERVPAQDLVLTTLSNWTCVQSNIFGFVMT